MLDARINSVPLWHLQYVGETELKDENGDYTGESSIVYKKPVKIRANLSPAHGSSEDDVFGTSVTYSKILTTANMKLGIDEHSLLSDKKPAVTMIDSKTCTIDGDFGNGGACYRVVRVAKGLYHMRYALKTLHEDDQ